MGNKYKLKCFGCGHQFRDKSEVCRAKRYENKPYCAECMGAMDQNEVANDIHDYYEKKWRDEHPGVDREQWLIDRNNEFKYGEC